MIVECIHGKVLKCYSLQCERNRFMIFQVPICFITPNIAKNNMSSKDLKSFNASNDWPIFLSRDIKNAKKCYDEEIKEIKRSKH